MQGNQSKQRVSQVSRVTLHKSGKHWVSTLVTQVGMVALKGAAVAGASLVLLGANGTVQADETDSSTDASSTESSTATLESAEVTEDSQAQATTTADQATTTTDSSAADTTTVAVSDLITTASQDASTLETSLATTSTTASQDTVVTKSGTTISVENPEVAIDASPTVYGTNVVTYTIPFTNDISIASGDTLTLTLPDELALRSSYSFNVLNADDETVATAVADPTTKTITTTFNNYFETHPINKSMVLTVETTWDTTVVVNPSQRVDLNFNGRVVPVDVEGSAPPAEDEVIAKWGTQSAADPNVNNWWIRFNNARELLNYVTITDTWGEGQEYVEGSINATFLTSWEGWVESPTNATQAQAFLNAFNVYSGGFEARLDQLNDILVLNYQTRTTNGQNPTNTVRFVAETNGGESTSTIQRVSGNGYASGEALPTPPTPDIPDTPVTPDTPPTPETPETPVTPPSTPTGFGGSTGGFSPRPSATAVATQNRLAQAQAAAPETTVATATLPETGSQEAGGLVILGLALMGSSLMLTYKRKEA